MGLFERVRGCDESMVTSMLNGHCSIVLPIGPPLPHGAAYWYYTCSSPPPWHFLLVDHGGGSFWLDCTKEVYCGFGTNNFSACVKFLIEFRAWTLCQNLRSTALGWTVSPYLLLGGGGGGGGGDPSSPLLVGRKMHFGGGGG